MFFNPLDKNHKSITGAVRENTPVVFRVKATNFAVMAIRRDGEPEKFYEMILDGDFFCKEISFSCGIYFYRFIADGINYGCGKKYEATADDNTPFLLSVYKRDYNAPSTLCGGIIYQIFPDRFYRAEVEKPRISGRILREDYCGTPYFLPDSNGKVLNNDFFGGDLKGITEKLSYLKLLNISAIYLNPIFLAASNHRYDTSDYLKTDPFLGTEGDLKNLIDSAKKIGIGIILDGVFNHTGDDSVYFDKYGNFGGNGAYCGKKSKYYDWYTFKEFPDDYDCWWGVKILPAISKNCENFQDFIAGNGGVIEKYTQMGVSGWRLDVVDELTDSFVKKIRTAVKRANPSATIIGEVWEDATDKISYGKRREYFLGEELDSVMNYPLKDAIIDFILKKDCQKLSYTVKSQRDRYPAECLNVLMNVLSTHDSVRILSALGDIEYASKTKSELKDAYLSAESYKTAKNRLKMAATLQFALCGTPSVYYGDEVGMQGYKDPLNRRYFEWDKTQKDAISSEIFEHYKLLGKLRATFDAFCSCNFTEVCAEGGVYAFIRKGETSEIFVAANVSDENIDVEFSGELVSFVSGEKFSGKYTLKSGEIVILYNK